MEFCKKLHKKLNLDDEANGLLKNIGEGKENNFIQYLNVEWD